LPDLISAAAEISMYSLLSAARKSNFLRFDLSFPSLSKSGSRGERVEAPWTVAADFIGNK
jgi:hypothetical protein